MMRGLVVQGVYLMYGLFILVFILDGADDLSFRLTFIMNFAVAVVLQNRRRWSEACLQIKSCEAG